MPNYIKYSTTTPSGSLRKGNMAIGVNPSTTFGPTSTTGFYAGINPSSGGYTIYQSKSLQGPSIYTISNSTDLINKTNTQVAGTVASPTNYTTAAQCLNYYAGQTDKICANFTYEGIVTDGLVLIVDAGYTVSYPTTASTWYDISGGNITGTLTNGPTFSSTRSGSIVFDGTNDYVTFGNQNLGIDLTSKSFCAWVNLSASLSNPTSIMDKQFDNTPPSSNYGGWGFWIGSDRKLWWWSMPNQDIRDNGSATIGTNVWTHIAITYNASTKTAAFYINGALNSSVTNANIVDQSSGTQPLSIAVARLGQVNQAGYLNGAIANVFAYNRVLTAAEILTNYNAQKSRFGL